MLYLAVSALILAVCPIIVVLVLAFSRPQTHGQMVVRPVLGAPSAGGRSRPGTRSWPNWRA